MELATTTQRFNAKELFTFSEVKPVPGLPPFFNLHFRQAIKEKEPFLGPGLYIISFDGEPIYLGKYLGRKQKPFSGNILDLRWSKHIATLTLRGKRLSLSRRALTTAVDANPGSAIVKALRNAESDVVHTDRGCVTTAPRVLFAHKRWGEFAALDEDVLGRFEFSYVRVEQPDEKVESSFIRQHVSSVESRLIEQFALPCNVVSNQNTNASSAQPIDHQRIVDTCATELAITTEEAVSESVADVTDNDGGLVNAFDTQLAEADEWAQGFVRELTAHFEERENVEVHYTGTGSGDLRLRVFWDKAIAAPGHQNFATIEWQPRNKAFRVNTEASANDMRALGMRLIDDPMPAQLKITKELYEHNKATLMRLFENAAILIKARNGALRL